MLPYLILFLLCVSCQNSAQSPHFNSIYGRNHQNIYRAQIPEKWKRLDPAFDQDLSNSMLPICSFQIEDILLTVHNFPSNTLEERISPKAQIERWKTQISSTNYNIEPYAHGGFGGYRLEAHGQKEKKLIALLAVSMQLTPVLYRTLLYPSNLQETHNFPEMRSDYTLKAMGPAEQIEAHREEINAFFDSFELIDPIGTDFAWWPYVKTTACFISFSSYSCNAHYC